MLYEVITGGDGEGKLIDHIPGVACDDGGSQDPVAPLSQMNAGEPFRLPVEKRPVHVG